MLVNFYFKLHQVRQTHLHIVKNSPVTEDIQALLRIRVQPKPDKSLLSDAPATLSELNLLLSPELLSPG